MKSKKKFFVKVVMALFFFTSLTATHSALAQSSDGTDKYVKTVIKQAADKNELTMGQVKTTPRAIEAKFILSEEQEETLSQADKAYLKKQMQRVVSHIKLYDNVEVQLPGLPVSADINSSLTGDLIQHPDAEKDYAESGGDIFTPENFDEVRETGILCVPSKNHKGQCHALNVKFIQGREKIKMRYEQVYGGIVHDTLVVELPRTFKSQHYNLSSDLEGWSSSVISDSLSQPDRLLDYRFTDGLKEMTEGLVEIFSLFIGTRKMSQTYTPEQIEEYVISERFKYVNEQLLKADVAITSVDEKQVTAFESLYGKKPDVRLHDQVFLKEQVLPVLNQVNFEIKRFWNSEAGLTKLKQLEVDALQIYQGQNLSDKQLEDTKHAYIREAQLKDWIKKVAASEELNDLGEGLGQRLADMVTATQITYNLEVLFEESFKQDMLAYFEQLKIDEPKKSESIGWLNYQVEQYEQQTYPQAKTKFYQKLFATLEDRGFQQEAFSAKRALKFQLDQRALTEAKLQSDIAPTINKTYKSQLWRSSLWSVEEIKYTDEKTGLEKSAGYRLIDYSTDTASSTHRGWRFKANLWQLPISIIKNLNYALAVKWFWNGPLGVKALFGDEEFTTGKGVNDKGEIVSVGSRVPMRLAISRSKQEALDRINQFESSEIKRWLPKKYIRWGVRLRHSLFNRTISPVVRGVAQPLATIGNAAVTGTLMATSVPISFLIGFGNQFIWTPLFHNNERSPDLHWLSQDIIPAPALFAHNVVIKGAGNMAAAAGAGLVAHPVMGLGVGLLGIGENLVSRAWDKTAMFLFELISNRSSGVTVPEQDQWGIERISGPGMSSSGLFYQVDPAVALLALAAHVEQEVLKDFNGQLFESELAPELALQTFNDIFGTVNSQGKLQSQIDQTQESLSEQYKELTSEAQENLARVLDTVNDEDKDNDIATMIVLPSKDLLEVQALGSALLKDKFTNVVFKSWTKEKQATFWTSNNLIKDDWLGLTKKLLRQTFGPRINHSLEEINEYISLEAPEGVDKLGEIIRAGISPYDINEYRVEIMSMKEDKVASPPAHVKDLELNMETINDMAYTCTDLLRGK